MSFLLPDYVFYWPFTKSINYNMLHSEMIDLIQIAYKQRIDMTIGQVTGFGVVAPIEDIID